MAGFGRLVVLRSRGMSLLNQERAPLVPKSSGPGATSAESPYNALALFRVFIFPALGSLLYGYDIGATSSVLSQMQDAAYSGIQGSDLIIESTLLQGSIISATTIGALIGSTVCFKIADDIGRRKTLLFSAIVYVMDED